MTTKELETKRKTLPELLNDEGAMKRFEEMLGKDARSFQQNILTVYNGSKGIQECEPESIIAGCAISASINLSILPGLGQSCIVPYADGKRMVAQWQIMTRGIIALAMRSEQYRKINLARVYDGQLVAHDEFKGTVTLDAGAKKSNRVQGYYFYFELLNGYTKESYWSAKKCIEHGLRFSKSFQKGKGIWTEDPEFAKAKTVVKWLAAEEHFLTEGSGADAMSSKTAVKNDLTKWGPLETRIKEIVQTNDQAAIGNDGKATYIDSTAEPTEEPKTYVAPPMSKKKEGPPPAEKIDWVRGAAKKHGVPNDQFDAWLKQQSGDESEVAKAAESAWKPVASKKVTAKVAFVVKAEDVGSIRGVKFKVGLTAKTTFYEEPAYVIRDTSEPPLKYYTDKEAIYKAAGSAKKDNKDLAVKVCDKTVEGQTYLWITELA